MTAWQNLTLAALALATGVAAAQTSLFPGSGFPEDAANARGSGASPAAAPATPNAVKAGPATVVAQPMIYPPARTPARSSNGEDPLAQMLMQFFMSRNSGGRTLKVSDGRDFSNLGMQTCQGKQADPTALQTMLECSNRKLSMASNAVGGLVDVDQKVMFIVNRASGLVTGCVKISTGKSTGDDKGQTPVGMMITRSHNGPKYQSNADGTEADCVGLQGTDPETIKRASNGVVMHKAHGMAGLPSTAGCIGIEDSDFDKVKDLLYGSDSSPKRSAIYIHTQNSREKCDGGGYDSKPPDTGNSNTGS